MFKLDNDLKQALDAEFVKEWAATRLKGRKPFIWRRGVFFWGGMMVVFGSLGFWIKGPWDTAWFITTFRMLVCPIGGWLVGASMWEHNEKRYANIIEASKNLPEVSEE